MGFECWEDPLQEEDVSLKRLICTLTKFVLMTTYGVVARILRREQQQQQESLYVSVNRIYETTDAYVSLNITSSTE